jgi:hypothetical protein
VLGAASAIGAAIQLALDGSAIFLGGDWLTAALLAIAFAALWLSFTRRAAARGMRRPAGFGIAAIIGLAAFLSPVFVVYAGPFISFGVGLAVAGLKLRNRVLTYWALGVGSIGVFEGFFGITNRLPGALWAAWEHPAIYLMLGAATFLAGVVIHRREGSDIP